MQYDFVKSFNKGLAAVEKNEKWGFVNKSGDIVIPLQYNYATEYNEGLALVKKDDKWGYINVMTKPLGCFIAGRDDRNDEHDIEPMLEYALSDFHMEK